MIQFLRMRWLFNRRVVITLLCFIGLLGVAFLVNVAGIRIAGDMESWMHWLKAYAPLFLVWRIVLYSSVACGWWWMRKRIIQRETDPQNRARFLRIEISTVCALLALEVSNWLA